MSFHHWMYFGCQCSSARCSRLLLERLTLFGIFSAEIMLIPSLHHVLFQSNSGLPCSPYTLSAPFSPTALGRWKIQFCHAVSRPKIFDSIVSGPAKRRLASIPVRLSGESEAG